MSDTGWKSPGAYEDNRTDELYWLVSNPENVYLSDNSYAFFDDWYWHSVEYKSFSSLSIPSGAIIDGIEVAVEAKISSGSHNLYIALSTDGGSNFTSDKTKSISATSDTEYTFGGSADTWGGNFNSGSFGNDFRVRVLTLDTLGDGYDIYIDHIQIKVYYTDNSTPVVGQKYALPPFKR